RETGPLARAVHDLDSFGTIPLGGKVERFAGNGVADAVCALWGQSECRRQSGRRARGVRGEAGSWPPSLPQTCQSCPACRRTPKYASAGPRAAPGLDSKPGFAAREISPPPSFLPSLRWGVLSTVACVRA